MRFPLKWRQIYPITSEKHPGSCYCITTKEFTVFFHFLTVHLQSESNSIIPSQLSGHNIQNPFWKYLVQNQTLLSWTRRQYKDFRIFIPSLFTTFSLICHQALDKTSILRLVKTDNFITIFKHFFFWQAQYRSWRDLLLRCKSKFIWRTHDYHETADAPRSANGLGWLTSHFLHTVHISSQPATAKIQQLLTTLVGWEVHFFEQTRIN